MIAAYELGGTGPQVLLLHGGGGTADHWQEFAAHLDGFRVVAIDLPGHGASSDSSWQWDQVLDELETLGLDGNGWPSTYPGLSDAEVAVARSSLNAVFKAQADAMAAALSPEQVEMLVAQQPLIRRNLVTRDGQTFLRPERPALDVIRELIECERTTSLYDGLRCPALAVVATRLFPAQEPFGDLLRAQQRGVVKDLAGRQVVEFDGSHGMLFEDPQGLAKLVATFLTGA